MIERKLRKYSFCESFKLFCELKIFLFISHLPSRLHSIILWHMIYQYRKRHPSPRQLVLLCPSSSVPCQLSVCKCKNVISYYHHIYCIKTIYLKLLKFRNIQKIFIEFHKTSLFYFFFLFIWNIYLEYLRERILILCFEFHKSILFHLFYLFDYSFVFFFFFIYKNTYNLFTKF